MHPGEHGSDQSGQYDDIVTPPRRSTASVAAGAGLQFAVSVVLFVLLGQWLDRRLGTAPVFLLVCLFVGAGGSFYSMYRSVTAAQRREDEAKARDKAREQARGTGRP